MKSNNASTFVIKAIIDGNSIMVHPRWKWVSDQGTIFGNIVKINGYNVENKNDESLAIAMLEVLLKPRPKVEAVPTLHSVKLLNPTYIDAVKGVMECSVYLDNVDISEYFSAFNKQEAKKLKFA